MTTTTNEIVASIDTHLRACRAQISALEAARSALGNAGPRVSGSAATASTASRSATPPTATRSATRKPASRRRRATTSARAEVVPAGKLEALLLATPDGLTTAALAQQAAGERSQVLGLLRELETAGQVRRSGQGRATRWHAVTDEDRIRERALELEALRRKAA